MNGLMTCLLVLALNLSPEELLKKVDDVIVPKDDYSFTMRFMVQEEGAGEREFEIKVYVKGEKRLIRFTYPPQVKGMAILSLGHDVMYVYMPGYKKVRRIASHVRNQTFLGTDFTYEDISIPTYGKDYNPIDAGEEGDFYFLTLKPKEEGKKDYGKLRLFVDRETFVVRKIEYYDRNEKLFKVETRGNFKRAKNSWIPGEVKMENMINGRVQMGKTSESEVEPLPDDLFTTSALLRGESK